MGAIMSLSKLYIALTALGIIRKVNASVLPAGMTASFAMNAAPAGWLAASGQAVSRTTYAALFAAIGTTYGVGDGITTFNLPPLNGRFVRGFDATVDPGRVFGSTQTDDLKAHMHTVQMFDSTLAGGNNSHPPSGGANTVGTWATSSTGGVETRPVNVAQLYCIKT